MEAHRVSPDDRARLEMETRENPMVVTAVVSLDGRLDRNELLSLVDGRLLIHEPMRARISLRHRLPWWKPEPTDARDHVTWLTSSGTDELASTIADVMRRPLDVTTWPWHVFLVDRPPEGSTLIFRAHHALADGSSLLRLLYGFSDEGASLPPLSLEDPRPPATAARIRPARAAAALARLVARHADAPPALAGTLSGQKAIAWSRPFAVESMRAAAHAVDAHINDVVLAVLAGALRDYLPPGDRSTLHALVPVALGDDAHGLGNHFVSVFVRLPVDLASPVERVHAAKEAMRRARAERGIGLGRALVAGAALLGHRAGRIAVRALSRRASLVATNVAGPPSVLHLGGRRIDEVSFAAPTPGAIALSANAFSYAGRLRVTLASDAGVIPRPEQLAGLVDLHGRRTIAALVGGPAEDA